MNINDKTKQMIECKIVLYNLLLIEDNKKEWKNISGSTMLREIFDSTICDGIVSPAISHRLKLMRDSISQDIGEERTKRILDYKESDHDSKIAKEEIFWYPKRNLALEGLNMSLFKKFDHWCKR